MQIRRWVSVVAVATVAVDQPPELIGTALIRARMCELAADSPAVHASALDLFLIGQYPQMHVLMGAELETTMTSAPVPEVVREALLGRRGPLWQVLYLVTAWEQSDWETVGALADRLGVRAGQLPDWYADALVFADARGVDSQPAEPCSRRPVTTS